MAGHELKVIFYKGINLKNDFFLRAGKRESGRKGCSLETFKVLHYIPTGRNDINRAASCNDFVQSHRLRRLYGLYGKLLLF